MFEPSLCISFFFLFRHMTVVACPGCVRFAQVKFECVVHSTASGRNVNNLQEVLSLCLSLSWTHFLQMCTVVLLLKSRPDYPSHPCAKSCFVRAVSGIQVSDTSWTIFTAFCLTCYVLLLLGEATNITQLQIAWNYVIELCDAAEGVLSQFPFFLDRNRGTLD